MCVCEQLLDVMSFNWLIIYLIHLWKYYNILYI